MTVVLPKESGLDHSVNLLKEGYCFIPNRMRASNTSVIQTRLLGQKVICIRGQEAAELFYNQDLFKRQGAAPRRILKSLFGKGGVQGLDEQAHKHRKALFMDLMTCDSLKKIKQIAEKQWEIAIKRWEAIEEVELFHELEKLMCITACQWTGVPIRAINLHTRTSDLSAMIDAFGAAGPRHWRGRIARKRAEKWITYIVEEVRHSNIIIDSNTPLYKITWHRDLSGELLDVHTAAVEVLNLLRPITAIGRFITFSTLALYEFPEAKQEIMSGDNRDQNKEMFVQEVRRYYPFAPFTGARVNRDFTWNHVLFKKNTLVLLDIYGTNHDSTLWENPYTFNPKRFLKWEGNPFNFIPQGGGEYDLGHRCAGEWITIELMKSSLHFLTERMSYEIPEQDLRYSLKRMPAIPANRLIINHVRRCSY
nr:MULTISPECIES: cytochrome P450 [Virgibacillus]